MIKNTSFNLVDGVKKKSSLLELRSLLEETLVSSITALESNAFRERFLDKNILLNFDESPKLGPETVCIGKSYLSNFEPPKKTDFSTDKKTSLYATLKDLNSLLEKEF
jgi:hypothetical protein